MSESKYDFTRIPLIWVKPNLSEKITSGPGVYQVYGDSPIYGTNTLLYIGQADNLSKRIKGGHLKNLESFITKQPNIYFRYAKVKHNLLNIVESILIAMHKPSFNSSYIINVHHDATLEAYYMQNHGDRGMLHLEVTNFYFFREYIDRAKNDDLDLIF